VSKPTRWIDYEERLARVTAYIHDHLDEPLDLNRLAEVACLSPYHWHRIYHGIHGETAANAVKRLRLHRAAAELTHGDLPIAQVAERSGYPNVASFTRVFRDAFGLPPAQYRREGSHMQYAIPQKQGDPLMFEVTVRHLALAQAVTLPHQGSYLKIGKAFETLFGWFAMRGLLKPGARSIGLYYDDPNAVAEENLRSAAGIVVETAPMIEAPMSVTPMAGGEYAVLRHKGPYSDLHLAYTWLYGTWLPQSGREVADTPVFEEYVNSPRDTPPAELLTDICLPLR
jgi:AraC family transcriptional regulator